MTKEKLTESRPLLGHARRIMKAIDTAVISLDDFETFQVYLIELGGRHRERQTKEVHLEHMRIAFIDAIRPRLESSWTTESSLAWNKLFNAVTQSMMMGINGKDITHDTNEHSDIEIIAS
ncbi:hypothetical protein QZH41_000871 [Actinostola sp. cb2023]|nr:hypothetical protein QZH41_000871 [Actinostola sp. cb2023]